MACLLLLLYEAELLCTRRLRLAAEEIGDTVKRLASTVDGKFDVSGNAQKAAQGCVPEPIYDVWIFI